MDKKRKNFNQFLDLEAEDSENGEEEEEGENEEDEEVSDSEREESASDRSLYRALDQEKEQKYDKLTLKELEEQSRKNRTLLTGFAYFFI
jgi:VIT1/CCC1 family predicted Fe2+/Mn2+ transporter